MSRRLIVVLLVLMAGAGYASAQVSNPSHEAREVVRRMTPIYPDLARRLQLSGVVKLRATVAPNGSVKSVELLGGHPVLMRAAQDAVTNWKYAPATAETQELIEVHFNTPH